MISPESEFAMHPELNTFVADKVKYYVDGVGPVVPTGEVSDTELQAAVIAAQAEIQHPAKVCIDERPALEAQPVRAKMAGGNLTTAFVAAELSGWSLYTDAQRVADPNDRVDVVADQLVLAGEVLGGHIDDQADEATTECNCGAAAGCPSHVKTISEHGQDNEFVAQMQDVLGALYDQDTHNLVTETAQSKVDADAFKGWSGWVIIRAVRARRGTVEVLQGSNQKPDKDPQNVRHNHWAEGVAKNLDATKSNNRDNNGVRFFQVDVPAVVETCQRIAKDEKEFIKLLHAAVAFQLAVRYNLTSGQPTVTVGS